MQRPKAVRPFGTDAHRVATLKPRTTWYFKPSSPNGVVSSPGFAPQAGQSRRLQLSAPGARSKRGSVAMETGARNLQRLHEALDRRVVVSIAAARRRADQALVAEPRPVGLERVLDRVHGLDRGGVAGKAPGLAAKAFGPVMTAMGEVTSAWSVFRPFGNNPLRSRSGTIGDLPRRLPICRANMSSTAPNMRRIPSSMPFGKPRPVRPATRSTGRIMHLAVASADAYGRRRGRRTSWSTPVETGRTRPSNRIVRPERTG